MHTLNFKEIVDTLTEALGLTAEQAKTAHEALGVAMHHKLAVVWTCSHVMQLARLSLNRRLTAAQARDVLGYLMENYSTEVGINDALIIETIKTLDIGEPIVSAGGD